MNAFLASLSARIEKVKLDTIRCPDPESVAKLKDKGVLLLINPSFPRLAAQRPKGNLFNNPHDHLQLKFPRSGLARWVFCFITLIPESWLAKRRVVPKSFSIFTCPTPTKEIKHSHKSSKLTLFQLCMAINPTKISPFTI